MCLRNNQGNFQLHRFTRRENTAKTFRGYSAGASLNEAPRTTTIDPQFSGNFFSRRRHLRPHFSGDFSGDLFDGHLTTTVIHMYML